MKEKTGEELTQEEKMLLELLKLNKDEQRALFILSGRDDIGRSSASARSITETIKDSILTFYRLAHLSTEGIELVLKSPILGEMGRFSEYLKTPKFDD